MRSAEVSPSGATSLPDSGVAAGAGRLSTGTLHLCKVALQGLSLGAMWVSPHQASSSGCCWGGCSAREVLGWMGTHHGPAAFPSPAIALCLWLVGNGHPKRADVPPHHRRLFPWLCSCSYMGCILQQGQHWGTKEWCPAPPGTSGAKMVWETLPEQNLP